MSLRGERKEWRGVECGGGRRESDSRVWCAAPNHAYGKKRVAHVDEHVDDDAWGKGSERRRG